MDSRLQDSSYHKVLRISLVVLAVGLLFQSGLFYGPTAEWVRQTERYVASVVGVQASVPPTELNQYTAALSSWERELEQREAAIREREITLRQTDGLAAENNYSTFILSALLFILLVLIVLNYVLDWLRAREQSVLYTTATESAS